MLPSEHPAIDYIPFPDSLEIETPSTEQKAARQGGFSQDSKPWLCPPASLPSWAYQCFQICTVSGKCLVSPYHCCPQFIDINPQLVLAYPKLRQVCADRKTDRETETEPLNEFTQELSIRKSRKTLSLGQHTYKFVFYALYYVLYYCFHFEFCILIFSKLSISGFHQAWPQCRRGCHLGRPFAPACFCLLWSPSEKYTPKSIFILTLLQSDSAASSMSSLSRFIFRTFTCGYEHTNNAELTIQESHR